MRIAEVPLVHERNTPSADTVLHAHESLLKDNRGSLDRTAQMVSMTFSNQLYHVQGLKRLYPDANVQFPPGETRQYYFDLLTDSFTHEPSQLANLWKLSPSADDPQEPFSHPRDRELFHILAYTSNKLKFLDKNGKTYHPKTRKMPDGSRVSYTAHTLLEVPHFIQTYTKDGNVSDLALALAAAHDVGEEGISASIRGNKISTEQAVDPAELVSRFSYEHIGTQLAIGQQHFKKLPFLICEKELPTLIEK